MEILRKRSTVFLISNILIPLGAIFLALLVGSIFLLIANVNPIEAYKLMFLGSFGSLYGLTETLVKATPLLLVGIGICISFRSGMINIGGEGQMVIGSILTTFFALNFSFPPKPILIPLLLLIGFIGGGIYGLIPGVLKAYLNINEILTTVMLNSIAIQILYLLLRGPMMDPLERAFGTGYPQSAVITKSAWLSRLIAGTRVHSGIFIAILLSVAMYFLLWKTTIGYRMRAVGKSKTASRYGGINVKKYMILSILISGGMAGIAGAVEVMGIHHRLLDGISAGYGFSGIVTALFGKLNPLGTIPASILFGAILFGADSLQRTVGIPAAMVYVIEGLVVVFVVSGEIISRRVMSRRVDLYIKEKE
jgi:simple sugar transport system permease protein